MLSGKVVLITGAARGIGAAAAREVASRGASVALVGLEGEELERTAAACGPKAAAFEADVTDWDALGSAVDAAVERFGGLDAVVANAGIGGGGAVIQIDPASFERIIEVNLLGQWRTLRTTLPHLQQRGGYALVVASAAAAFWNPGMSAYNASKAGVEALARTAAAEMRHLGVRVGTAYFSWIDTDLVRAAQAHPATGELMRERLRGPLGRVYPVEETGRAIADGIEKRARTVAVPSWVKGMLALRGLLQPLIELGGARGAPEAMQRMQADIDARGAAASSAPAGPGGEAAMRTAARG